MNQTVDEKGKPDPLRPGLPALETRLLAERLGRMEAEEYELVTYAELSAIAGCDVQRRGRGYLGSAREIVLRDKGYVFRPERNVGIRRMTPIETSKGCGNERITHVRRTHKKGLREQATIDLEKLPESDRPGHLARISLMAMTVHTHKGSQLQKLESALNGTMERLPLAKTLEAFKE